MKSEKGSMILCSPTESVKLRFDHTCSEMNWAMETMKIYSCRAVDQMDTWNLAIMIADVFNAGRISGIRQERRRRAAHE